MLIKRNYTCLYIPYYLITSYIHAFSRFSEELTLAIRRTVGDTVSSTPLVSLKIKQTILYLSKYTGIGKVLKRIYKDGER
jgi:hypothetical protein